VLGLVIESRLAKEEEPYRQVNRAGAAVGKQVECAEVCNWKFMIHGGQQAVAGGSRNPMV
jgi:hypothetical protein